MLPIRWQHSQTVSTAYDKFSKQLVRNAKYIVEIDDKNLCFEAL